MGYDYFSRNGELLPTEQAQVSINDIAYSYGFGVYETIRVHNGIGYFSADHLQRLLHSAAVIGLEHTYTLATLSQGLHELISKNTATEANVKLTLVGGRTAAEATLYMQLHNPLFPERSLYKHGAHTVTEVYERLYPTAKTLNMLPSYLAYRRAQANDAYDALLVNQRGEILEGTRTNFFALRGQTIYGAPEATILSGVMRKAVLICARQEGLAAVEQAVSLATIADYEAAFLTSTSTKIMPLRSIDEHRFAPVPAALTKLMTAFTSFYNDSNGILSTER